MKVTFVSIGDPRDPHVWSGIPHNILRHLVVEGCEVEVIAPLHRSFRFWYLGQKVIGKVCGVRFDVDRQPLALRSYRDQIADKLKHSVTDVIFSPSSVPISMLNGNVPVIYWTDAVWDTMIDYYEGFSHFSQTSRVNGHRQEQMAMDRAALAIYSSDWAANSARDNYKVDPSKVKTLSFGANIEVNHAYDSLPAVVRNRRRDQLRLLFLGVDWERKG